MSIIRNLIISNTQQEPGIIDFPREAHDAFNKHRVSNPETIFEFSHRYGLQTEFFDSSTTGGATVTYDSNKVSAKLSTTTASGDKAVYQSLRSLQYFKGKSQLIYLTGNFDGLLADVRKRYGYFDENNGVFFETNGTALRVVKRSNTTGSVVDTVIDSTSWNIDRLDGSGDANNPSGLTADPTKQQLFVIDFSWLGSNIVRWGIKVGDKVIYIHQENFSNITTEPYMATGNLPIRAEIENLAAIGAGEDFYVSCGTVISEGGKIKEGVLRIVDTGASAVSVNTTEKVVAGIRINSSNSNASIKPVDFSLVGQSGSNNAYFKIIIGATLTSPTWSALTGVAEGLTNNPAYTGGKVIASGFFDLGGINKSPTLLTSLEESNDYLGVDLSGTSQTLILVVRTVSGSGSVLFSGSYKEFY